MRIATDVFEQRLPPLAADEDERRVLVEGVLRFGRGVAFAAATAYAAAAEDRGAWDARLEALVVDAVVRGRCPTTAAADGRRRRARLPRGRARLGPALPARVVVGAAPDPGPRPSGSPSSAATASGPARRCWPRCRARGWSSVPGRGRRRPATRPTTLGLGSSRRLRARARSSSDRPAADLSGAHASAREALAGLRAAPGRPDAPRPVAADDLLPERALGGDPAAHRRLIDSVVAPLAAAGGELLRTLAVYVEGGGALEACARAALRPPEHRAVPAAPDRRDHRPLPHRSA